jgi:hypothetical protein
VRHGFIGLAISIAASSCGGGNADPPQPIEQAPANVEQTSPGLRFVATVEKLAPAGTLLAVLAEVNVSHEGRMKAVVVTHRGDRKPELQIDLWTFAQRKEDELEPLGNPQLVLGVAARAPETPELEALRRELSAPASMAARPQGLPLTTATDALERMQELAKIVRDDAADPRKRVDALAEFMRGLDDDIWLSQQRVPWMLDLFVEGPWIVIGQPDGSAHRTRMRAKPGEGKPEFSLAFLLKSGGWVLQEFEQRR